MDETVQKIPRDLFVDNLNNFNNLTQVQKVHSKTFLEEIETPVSKQIG